MSEEQHWYSYDGEGNDLRVWFVCAHSEADAYSRAHEAGMPKRCELRPHGGPGVVTIYADSATLNNEPPRRTKYQESVP